MVRIFRNPIFLFCVFLMVALFSCNRDKQNNATALTAKIPDQVDFNLHVRPILSDKCFACHGPDANKRKAGLRFDEEEGVFAELEETPGAYAVVPGDVEASVLYHRIYTQDTNDMMPPPESLLAMSDREKTILTKWIEQGAEYKPHWSFIPPVKADQPKVSDLSWPQQPLDYFILAKLDEVGLNPNPEADKERLLKRVAYDLTGLPPEEALIDQFLADDSDQAYEKIVDQLFASPHYGEKMALPWLDAARYADSHGYQDDGLRTMWPWRDWVIHAFNQNYPYDQFLTWQLAGDLLPNPTKEMLLATGFNRNHKITQEGGVIDEEYRIEYVTDRTNTFGKAILGLTYECAKCHEHKYDPIGQKEYFRTFAFFNQVPEKGIFGTIDASFADPPNMEINDEDLEEVLEFVNKMDSGKLEVMVMKDQPDTRPTYILNRGVYDAPTTLVDFGTPEAILPFDTSQYPKNRLGLAQWCLDEKNPLVSRVFVNRIWQEIFGRGLVKTAGDFGMQGDLPSHLSLLDWLAVDFREKGWDIKHLVKQIVMSATYRQSAEVNAEKLDLDPENVYLARSPRMRFSAEMVRDHVLASSGLLNDNIGGESVKTYQPKGIWESSTSGRGLLQKYVPDEGDKLYRRGMYQFIKRTAPPPVMLMFDASNRDQCEVKRVSTNTPLQALAMMNDPHVLEASRVMAENLTAAQREKEEAIQVAFKRIMCRQVKTDELSILSELYEQELEKYRKSPTAAEELLENGEYPRKEISDLPAVAALMQTIHAIYNLEEAITKT